MPSDKSELGQKAFEPSEADKVRVAEKPGPDGLLSASDQELEGLSEGGGRRRRGDEGARDPSDETGSQDSALGLPAGAADRRAGEAAALEWQGQVAVVHGLESEHSASLIWLHGEGQVRCFCKIGSTSRTSRLSWASALSNLVGLSDFLWKTATIFACRLCFPPLFERRVLVGEMLLTA
jgi:hypothetical protein